MTKPRDVLILTGPYLESGYNIFAEYANRANWRLEIAERYNPPRNWTGDGVLSMFLDEPVMNSFLESLVRRRIPVVDLFGIKKHKGMGAVIHDNEALGRMAAQHFHEHGFVRAAFYAFEWTEQHDERYDSFATAWRGAPPYRWIWPKDPAFSPSRKALAEWTLGKLRSAETPLAVYTYNSYNAAYLSRLCLDHGIDIPHDVAVLSANDRAVHNCCSRMTISGIDRNEELKYHTAAKLLDRMMRGKAERNTIISIKPKGVVARRSTDVTAMDSRTLRKAAAIISNSLSARHGPSKVAKKTGVSLRKLNAMSRAELGHSIIDEITRLRIEKAKRLMIETDDKLAAVAAAAGFCNASYFCKVFRNTTGFTPHCWRRLRRRPESSLK
jgi:LacI family transcriptional regulator